MINSKLNLKNIAVVMMFTMLSACAGLTKRVDDAQVQKIKKVAVIAYTANLPATRTIGLDLGSGKVAGERGGSIIPANSPDTDKIYAEFLKSLEKTQSWKVVEINAMTENAGYQQAFQKTMDGWQNKVPANSGTVDFNVKKVMDWNGPRLLGFEGREKLIKDLGVDAIIMLKTNVVLEGFTVVGIGSRKPQAHAHIQVYGKGVEEAIWFETFEGALSNESVGMTGFINEKRLGELSLISAQTAFAKMGSKIN
jgi:hypothetical protein